MGRAYKKSAKGKIMIITDYKMVKAVFEDESNTEYIREYVYNNILHVVDPDTYPEDRWTGTYKP